MFILDSLLIGSLRFVLDKVVQAAEAEAQDDSALRDQLLEAQMRLELGEITEAEFAGIERDVLAAIREIRRPNQGALSMSPNDRITGVDIESFDTDEDRKNCNGHHKAGPAFHLLRRQWRRRQDDVRGRPLVQRRSGRMQC